MSWKTVKYLKEPLTASPEHATWQFELELPEPLASWDVFDYWEKERVYSMRDHLKHGDVLLDVGAESGWMSVVFAQLVGAENVVLIEPTREFWPNIHQTWKKNGLSDPRGSLVALMGDKNVGKVSLSVWPKEIEGEMIDKNKYQYIHENPEKIPQITLDYYSKHTAVVPDALTIDVEGAELLVLKGAKDILAKHKPLIWVSVHPDLGERDYGVKPQQVHELMQSMGYRGVHLETDHEEHWFFR